jgi:hypothetical protein
MRRTACVVFGVFGSLCAGACGDSGRDDGDSATGVTGASATGVTVGSATGVTGSTVSTTPTEGSASEAGETADPPTSGPDDDTGVDPTMTVECDGDEDCPPGTQCAVFNHVCIPEGTCQTSEDCEGGKECVDGGCVIGGDCGAESFELTAVPPNVMIVLDRSGSMGDDVQDSNKNRWGVAKDAIDLLVNTFNNDIRFGLVTYSACEPGEACTAGEIVVPVGNLAAGPITGFLGGKGDEYLCNSGDPETSTGNTLYALLGEPSIQDPERGNAVLLITDGNENDECQDNTNAADAAGKLFAQAPPVRTYAVGFADGILGSLADVATAGGTGTPYNANNPASLEAALNAIAGAVASCDFVLGAVPDDPGEIYVFFNDDPAGVPLSEVDGWTYDPATNTIHFHGVACDQIKTGVVLDIDVVFGCDIPVPG